MPNIVYSARAISKRFGPQIALDGVDIDLREGEILGLVGSNGAGKSTLMRILAGASSPDQGRLMLDGNEITMQSMQEAWRLGIAFVSQELNLFPTLSIAENLGLVPGQTNRLSTKVMQAKAAPILQRLGLKVDFSASLGTLTLAERQLVEIARALLQNPRVLILDEPTSALQSRESAKLHDILRELKKSETSIIYISHFIEELLDISDSIVVLRDGKRVTMDDTSARRSVDKVVAAMLGDRSPGSARPPKMATNAAQSNASLSISGLRGPIRLNIDSLEAKPGEVVGLAGLAGSGVEELFAILFGRLSVMDGKIQLPSGKTHGSGTATAVANGIAYFPSDRKRLGLAVEQSICENVSAVRSLSLRRDGFMLSHRRQSKLAYDRCRSIGIKMDSVNQPVRNLSGGNQQKVVFAKWVEGNPSLLLLDDPMRGVDVGAKQDLCDVIRRINAEGRVILIYSSDPSDYVAIADRVLVFAEGRIAEELKGDRLTEHEIVTSMNSGTPAAANSDRKSVDATGMPL